MPSPWLFGHDPEMTQATLENLKRVMKAQGIEYCPDKSRLSTYCVQQILRQISEKCGFRFHPHLLRKTMATQAMSRGMPIDEVRIMLGHENIATTTIYAQTLKDNVKSSHEKYV